MNENKKNILIIGKSGTATALANKFAQNENIEKIFITPELKIKSEKYTSVDIREDDLTGLLKFALENDIDLTIPVSEKALNSDIVSFFQTNGQNIFGPVKDACSIATNKTYGKKFLYKIHAQTSKFGVFDKLQLTEDFLNNAKFPITIKCNNYNNLDDRLVCTTVELAREYLENLFAAKNETNVLIEEYTYGHNFTIYYITDGYSALPISAVGNYKFSENGDGGLLTNGTGCYTPDYKISETVISRVGNIVNNTLTSLEKRDMPYVGILGVECTLTGEDKFYVNEFKPFLQDYDAAAVLNLIEDDLVEIFMACINGFFADEYEEIKTNELSSTSAVISSRGINKVIKGLEGIEDIENIIWLNINKTTDEKYLTNKGEVLVITRTASTLNRAKSLMYEDIAQISFDGMKFRNDILNKHPANVEIL